MHKTRNQKKDVLLHTTLHTITRNCSRIPTSFSKEGGVFFRASIGREIRSISTVEQL